MGDHYSKNETMHMLGRQDAAEAFWYNDQVREEIRQISKRRPYSFTLDAASEIFMLGYIHGKRTERLKRKEAV